MHIALRAPTAEDADIVASKMRHCDRQEIWASHRATPRGAIAEGMAKSTLLRVGTADDYPVCMFGVTRRSWLSNVGTPWMLATPALESLQRPFLRLSLPVIDLMQDAFPMLENYCDARNKKTIRWLKWLGFTVEDPAPHGVDLLPFCRFTRSRSHV